MINGHRHDARSGLYLPDAVTRTEPQSAVPDTVPAEWSDSGPDTAPMDVVDTPEPATEKTPEPSKPEPESVPEPEPKEKSKKETARESHVRPAIARWLDRRTDARTAKSPRRSRKAKTKVAEPITKAQVVTVCAMAAAVSLGAFVLSFDMMAIAAEHYGWAGWLAKLFPVVIDAGAVAGVVMAGLTSNPVFRRNGWALGALTLAASLVFNVTGHAITGQTMAGIPESYAWTSTAAALLIPCLLAVFVHSAASALHQWTAQERAAQQTAAKPEPTTEVSVPTRSAAPAKATKAKTSSRPVSSDEALAIGRASGAETPAQLRDAILAKGKTAPSRGHLSHLINHRADWLN